jgi:hypothetical protein
MVDVRNLVINVTVNDTATAVVSRLRTLVDGFNSAIVLSVDTSAIQDAQSAISEVVDSVTQPFEGSVTFDTTDVTNAQTAISDLWREEETAAESSSKLTDIWNGLKDAASGISNSVNGAIDSIKASQLAIGAVVGLGANEAFKVQSIDDAVAEMFKGGEQAGIQKWLASRPPYIAYDERATGLIKMVQKGMKVAQAKGLQEAMESAEFVKAATWKVAGVNIEGLSQTLSRLSSMGVKQNTLKAGEAPGQNRLGRMLQPYGLSLPTKDEINKAKSALSQAGELTGLKGPEKDKAIWIEAMRAKMLATGKADMANLNATQRIQIMTTKIADLKDEVLGAAVPALMQFVNVITDVAGALKSFPGLTTILGLITAFMTVAVIGPKVAGAFFGIGNASLSLLSKMKLVETGTTLSLSTVKTGISGLAGAFKNPIGAIKGFVTLVTTGMKAVTMSLYEMAIAAATNPLVWIAVAVIVVGLLAYKLGYLQKAWEMFTKSAIGKDVIQFFVSLGYLVTYVFQVINQLWESFKKSDAAKSILTVFDNVFDRVMTVLDAVDKVYSLFKGGGKISVDNTWIGKGLNKEVVEIQTRLYNFLYEYVKKIYSTFTQFGNWLHGVWDTLISIPAKIGKFISDAIKNPEGVKNAIGTAAKAADVAATNAGLPITGTSSQKLPMENLPAGYTKMGSSIIDLYGGRLTSNTGGKWSWREPGGIDASIDEEAAKRLHPDMYNMFIPQAQKGGEITKSGMLIGHENEPIIPAKIARSSNLIDALSRIASTPSSMQSDQSSSITNHITVNFPGAILSPVSPSGFSRDTEYRLKKFIDDYICNNSRHRQAH